MGDYQLAEAWPHQLEPEHAFASDGGAVGGAPGAYGDGDRSRPTLDRRQSDDKIVLVPPQRRPAAGASFELISRGIVDGTLKIIYGDEDLLRCPVAVARSLQQAPSLRPAYYDDFKQTTALAADCLDAVLEEYTGCHDGVHAQPRRLAAWRLRRSAAAMWPACSSKSASRSRTRAIRNGSVGACDT
jgi:hypothetical protein